jgi:hypothetical protein
MPMPSGAYSSNGSSSNMSETVPVDYSKFKLNNYTPDQMQLHQQQYSQVDPNSYLSKLANGDQNAYEEMERPALQQFNSIQGNIASRFSGMGMGSRNSSGFQNSMNSASQDFAGQLQSKRADMRRQAIMDLMGLSNQILNQKPYEKGLVADAQQEQKPAMGGWAPVIGAGVGAVGGMYMGNPVAGAQIGYGLGSAI